MAFYYDKISVNEGIDTKTFEHHNDLLMKVFQKDVMAAVYFFIKKTILTIENELANKCHKILINPEIEPRNICIIWRNNCKYRVLTTLKRGQARRLKGKVEVQNRYGYIDIDNLVEIYCCILLV